LLRAYGAEIECVSALDTPTGSYLPGRQSRAKALGERRDWYWTNQYANPANALAHQLTMAEIVDAVDGPVDYVFVATSTCGTLRGCVEYARQAANPKLAGTRFVAVDAVGSITFGGEVGPRLLPGHGVAVLPGLYAPDLADEVFRVDDRDCVDGCRRLLDREALLAGGSSGGVVVAVERLLARRPLRPGGTIVAVLADGGDRYLDTVYCDEWVRQHFGDAAGASAKPRQPTRTLP
jgi:cysteine synthase A